MNANWIKYIKELEYKNKYYFYDGYSGRLFHSNKEENLIIKQIRYYYAINDSKNFNVFEKEKSDAISVRRHIMGGANRTLISALLPLRLRSRVGNRKLSAGQPHAVAALLEKQESCF